MSASASSSVAVGGRLIGAEIMPAWARLTRSTSSACCSTDRLRWSTPIPPARAIAIASGASVTVSMAADMSGHSQFDPGERRRRVDLGRQHFAPTGDDEHVIEGERLGAGEDLVVHRSR